MVGADVRRGFGTAYVLFARLERQRVAGAAGCIGGLPHQPPRQLAQEGRTRGHVSGRRPAKRHGVAEYLHIAHGDVCPQRPRCLQQAEGHGILHYYQQCSRLVSDGRQSFHIFNDAQEVWLLYYKRPHSVQHRSGRHRRSARSRVERQVVHREPRPGGVSAHYVQGFGVKTGGQKDPFAPGLPQGQERRLRCGRRPVPHGCVGHVQAGQLAYGRLEFEDVLERALAHLGLVGRVGGGELGAPDHRPHRSRDVVLVATRSQEAP